MCSVLCRLSDAPQRNSKSAAFGSNVLRRFRRIEIVGDFEAVFAQLIEPADDLIFGAVQQHAAADRDHVAEAQDAKLHVFAVDARAVGAFQIGQHELAAVFLNLDVVSG